MSFDALSFLRDNGVQYYEEGENVSRGWAGIRCPFCYDHSNHGGFNIAGGYYYCWKCGGHDLVDVVKELLHVPYKEALAIVMDYSARGAVLRQLNEKKVAKAKTIELPGEQPLQRFHKRYLRSRGFDPEYVEEKYKVLGTGPMGDFKLRVVIPIIYQGKTVSFTSRDITNKQLLRYKTLSVEESVVNPKHVLYSLDDCRKAWVGVVEGVFDSWRLGEDFCASFGTQLTDQQIRLLSNYERVVFLFDSEVDAQKRAEKYAAMLGSLGCRVFVLDIEAAKDPADLSDGEAEKLRRAVQRIVG